MEKIFFYFFIFLTFHTSSFAYLDPGAGNIIKQLLAAIGVSIIVFFKGLKTYIMNIYNQIKSFIKKEKSKKIISKFIILILQFINLKNFQLIKVKFLT
tara:strand:- start:292 stop:585 length:294 start_codon:yes stop_codon:yes gene_type:complete